MTRAAAAPVEDPSRFEPVRRRPPFVPARLSVMMLLQYAVWGIWLPILAKYLGTPVADGGIGLSGGQVGWILGLAGSVGAVSSPFIAGQLADRVMNAERALGLLLIGGGAVQLLMTNQTTFTAWLLLSILYSVLYMPTLALTNSVAFANLEDRERQFPPVRTFGTIGWIVASVGFALIVQQTAVHGVGHWPFLEGTDRVDAVARMKYAMPVAGVISIVYGLLCFVMLPATPPIKENARPLAFAAAFRLLTRSAVIALLVAALLVSMIHQVYFIRMGPYITDAVHLPASRIQPIMAIGQISEIFFLAILGLFIKQVGYKWIIALGALSYALRYAVFGLFPQSGAVQMAMLLHGMSYGFFFAGAFLYVERIAPADIRHSVQTVFGIIILGLGPILAGAYNEWLQHFAVRSNATVFSTGIPWFDFREAWLIQAGIGGVAMILLIVAFPGRLDVADEQRGFRID